MCLHRTKSNASQQFAVAISKVHAFDPGIVLQAKIDDDGYVHISVLPSVSENMRGY